MCPYRPRLGAETIDKGVAGGQAVGASEAAQLVTFVVGLSGLLLALEVGLRRVHRRRGALVQRSDQDGVRRTR